MSTIWEPNPGPQTAFVTCPADEVFFGGSRGGGKTDGSLGDWISHWETYRDKAEGLFVRKVERQLEQTWARAHALMAPIGAKFNYKTNTITMPGGGNLKFRYLGSVADADEYHGHSYSKVFVEEVGNYGDPEPINRLKATLRSPHGVPCSIRMTGNPCGAGHYWLKKRFIEPAPQGGRIMYETFNHRWLKVPVTLSRVFIKSLLKDNPKLMENDPQYLARLSESGPKELVDAWIEGNWDLPLGQFFTNFNPISGGGNVLPSELLARVPYDAPMFTSFDWGSKSPFCFGWYVISDGSWGIPRDVILKTHEFYGARGDTEEGLDLTIEDMAHRILKIESGLPGALQFRVADTEIFNSEGRQSIAARFGDLGLTFLRADKRRIPGLDTMRSLIGSDKIPRRFMILAHCVHTVDQIRDATFAANSREETAVVKADHAMDETRYMVQSLIRYLSSWTPSLPAAISPQHTFDLEFPALGSERVFL